ncbi:MAG TPA: GNAT family N-acetyltransferase [Gemmatimonadales bacterium]|nr:GNAT family N-acetyltransferase [Gemmatimonadales bacterium]
MAELDVARYDARSKPEVVELLRLLASPDRDVTRRYLEWKYEENPILREPVLYLVRAEGRLVGMRGLLAARWEAGHDQAPVMMPYPDDHVVAESHRKSGVASLLMRTVLEDAAARGYPYLCNLSAGLTTMLTSLAAGWKRVRTMDQLDRPTRPGVLWRSLSPVVAQSEKLKRFSHRRGWSPSTATAFKRLDRIGEDRGATPESRIAVVASPPAESMAALIRRLGHDGRIRHVRDAEWIDWRYRHPLHEYRFLIHETAGTMDGYLAIRRLVPERAPGRCHIVDWEASSDCIASTLLDRAARWGQFPVLGAWGATVTPSQRRMLDELGFAPADHERRARGLPALIVTTSNGDGAGFLLNGCPMLEQGQWDLRTIYSMQG